MDNNVPKPQTDIDQNTDVNEIAFRKLQIRQSNLKEEMVEMTNSMIPPPLMEMPEGTVEKNDSDGLSEVERKLQQKRRKI